MPLKQSMLFDFDDTPPAMADGGGQTAEKKEATPQSEVQEEPKEIKLIRRGRPKLSELSDPEPEIPEDEILFQKKYYSIGTVAGMFKVNVSLLRFWENEFDSLKPKKNGKGDRLFRPEDVKTLKQIHHLLRERKYTIEGAKDFLRKNERAGENFGLVEDLKDLQTFLRELKQQL